MFKSYIDIKFEFINFQGFEGVKCLFILYNLLIELDIYFKCFVM